MGRTEGDIEQADAALTQRSAEVDDLRSRIESDVLEAYLDMEAAGGQVDVAVTNVRVTKETLDLTRQRFDAGVTDNVEVVQAQESMLHHGHVLKCGPRSWSTKSATSSATEPAS